MKQAKRCSECSGTEIYTSTVSAGGGYAPDILPGAHPSWRSGKIDVFICGTCGNFQYFVPDEALDEVRESKRFRRVV